MDNMPTLNIEIKEVIKGGSAFLVFALEPLL